MFIALCVTVIFRVHTPAAMIASGMLSLLIQDYSMLKSSQKSISSLFAAGQSTENSADTITNAEAKICECVVKNNMAISAET